MTDILRIGIVGVGNMGSSHAGNILDDKIPNLKLTALCDRDPARLTRYKDKPGLALFDNSRDMIRSGKIDAVLVATPHYDHTTVGIDALGQGLHLLVEKPISVHKADCQRLIEAYEKRPKQEQVFAAMFNQRTDPHYQKLRDLVISGELGEIRRIVWNITDWFRPQCYYDSGGWRATWGGEGGGVLLNQCPHNLDLWQWIFGMPVRLRAFCSIGKYHRIEVEDDVTAYLEYPNGATGIFLTTTGEAPGSNRLEVTGERGKVVIDKYAGEGIRWWRNNSPTAEYSRTTSHNFGRPEVWEVTIPARGSGGQHNEVLKNFTQAILKGEPLLAPGVEGIHSVELANAMLYSSFTGLTVEFPLDAAAYETHLRKLIAGSKFVKPAVASEVAADFSNSLVKA